MTAPREAAPLSLAERVRALVRQPMIGSQREDECRNEELRAIASELERVAGEMTAYAEADPGPPGPRWKPLARSTVGDWADTLSGRRS